MNLFLTRSPNHQDTNPFKDDSYRNIENLKIRCPVCNHDYVSLAKIDGRLPGEVQQFFTPFPTQIEQMFAASHFQYCALVEKINSQANLIDRLVQKINKQKSLLLLAKEKVGQVDEMEKYVIYQFFL